MIYYNGIKMIDKSFCYDFAKAVAMVTSALSTLWIESRLVIPGWNIISACDFHGIFWPFLLNEWSENLQIIVSVLFCSVL